MARFWDEVTMMTCSMPAATASSTAYWMTGLSTRGGISFGCALLTGRKRVPQPAAGKTALRTRIEPLGQDWRPPVYPRPPGVPRGGRSGRGHHGPGEGRDACREGAGPVDAGQVAGPSDHIRTAVAAGRGPRLPAGPAHRVERPLEDQDPPPQ